VSHTNLIQDLTYEDLNARKINEKTCRHWDYGISTFKGKPCQVACYRTPDGSKIVAQKVRFPGKDFLILGDISEAGLYGQHLSRDGGKMVVITEGEIDALSVSQVQDLKWSVVSVPNGAQGAAKAVRKQLEWLEKFESVIFMLDNDEPGRAAAAECAELLTPGKAKIASLPLKDANDMLKAGQGAKIIDAIWSAKPFRPDGIIAGTDLWDVLIDETNEKGLDYPWEGVNRYARGIRQGEINLVGAGTGVGKSEWVRQIAHHLLAKQNETVGYIALEESKKRTARGMVGLHIGKRIHLSREGVSDEELKRGYDETVGSGRFFLYDHWGSTASDNLLNKVRYLVRGCGCTTIVLDHISIVVSGIEDGDERRIIDNTMTRLRSLVEETKCRMFVIAHLKAIEGTPHEEGARVTLGHFRGSKSLTQLSDIVIGLERNQQDPEKAKYTTVRFLKNRPLGENVGVADILQYDTNTGLMHAVDPKVACVFGEEDNKDF
jgi:twinkle protein